MSTEYTEEAPLLRAVDRRQDHASDRAIKLSVAARITIAAASLLLLLAVEIADILLAVPRAQVEESIVCRKHYPDVALGSDDPRCQENNVQSELSMLQAMELTCAILPGLLTAMPWGIVADKYGRLFVLRLTLLGLVLYEGANIIICRFPDLFPIQLVWVSPVFMLMGGGLSMASTMIYTVASDVSSEAQRATAFFYVGAAALIGELLSKPITYLAMEHGIWFAIYLGYMFLVICLLSLLVLPNLLTSLVEFEFALEEDQPAEDPAKITPLASLRHHASSWTSQMLESFSFLFRENRKLGLVILSIMFTSLGKMASVILLQYIRKRFGWSWSQANLLLSVKSFTALGLALVILPATAQLLLVKVGLPPLVKDLWMARGSIILLIAGAFAIGFASSLAFLIVGLVLFALGSGYGFIARSLLTSVASGHHIAMLYATVSFVEMSGVLIASPLLAASFRIGLRLDGVWVGLPFMSAGCLFTLAAIIVFRLNFTAADRSGRLSSPEPNMVADDED